MIGIYAILMDAGFVAFGLLMLAGASWDLVRTLRRRPTNVFNKNDRSRTPEESFGIMAFATLWLAVLSVRLLSEVRCHSDLSHLRPETVERIEIGTQAVTDRQQIAEIILAVNHPEWYSLHRGDGADEVPFVVKLASGKQYDYQVTRYLRGEGAALVSHSPSGWKNGEVFCRRLPASLKLAGVTLPDCVTYSAKPQRCAGQ
jgi:hypothetical protein